MLESTQGWRHQKVLALLLLGLLNGCDSPIPTPATDIVKRSPIDAATLGVENLVSFDVYADGPHFHALFAATTNDPKKTYIGYLSSNDGGLNWSTPREIGHYVTASLESRIGNDVQIAAAGNTLLAVWQVSGEIPGMGPLVTLTSVDGGQNWRPGTNPTGSATDQSHADLAADSQGRFHLVWLDDRDENGYLGVRYARSSDAGQHWELAKTIDDSSCSCCWNRIVTGPNEQVSVLYRDMEPRDMALAQSADAGQSWQLSSMVGAFNWHFDGCPHNGGGLTLAGNDTWHSLVWTGADKHVGLYHLQSADNGKHWSAPQPMTSGLPAFHSDIANGHDHRIAAIWDALGDNGSTVVISESLDNGARWSTARPLSNPDVSATFPRILATPTGWLAFWQEQKPGSPRTWQSAILQ